MPTPVWPVTINHLPMRGSVRLVPHDNHVRTSNEIGPQRVRRRYTSHPSELSFNIEMNEDEFELFKTFYVDVLLHGSVFFDMLIRSGNVFDTHLVRFKKKYEARDGGVFLWIVAIQLEVKNLRINS